jgi:release factor glutamine methyltransferase
MRPTPDYSAWYDYTDSVYEPSEDSFVFLDGIEKEIEEKLLEKPGLAVEIGSGSGVISCAFASWTRSFVLALDINELCSECTSKNAEKNGATVDCAVDNSGKSLRAGNFDYVLLNPPYVVTTSEELQDSQKKQDLSASWSGGNHGTELLFSSLLPKALELLNPSGCLYLIAIRENVLEEIREFLKHKGYSMEIVIERKAGREYLYLLKVAYCANQ